MLVDRNLVRYYLERSRSQALANSHAWDIADVMEALELAGVFATVAQQAEATDLKSES